MSEEMLRLHELNVWYRTYGEGLGRRRRRQVLFDVSMEMRKGEILGLAGESGCGKSTLARTIMGTHRLYEGERFCADPHPQMVFQDPFSSLNPAKTIGWLLEEPLRVDPTRDYTPQERHDRAREMMAQIGLTESLMDRRPAELSGGQRQRVCIGAALMCAPGLLVADEPVSALDVTIQAQILELLKTLHQEMNLSILFISHDLRVIYNFCDRVLILQEGRIVEAGPCEQVYRDPQAEYTKKLLVASGIRT